MNVKLQLLPHWSRVAFTAQCARRVQPLFTEAWPEATPARVASVEQAIILAERSAVERKACAGLESAYLDAVVVAGRALIPHQYPMPPGYDEDEPSPAGPEAALLASFAAKVAEHAARTADALPDESAQIASEGYGFALHAIDAAGRPDLVKVLEADFVAAVKSASHRPWWRFW